MNGELTALGVGALHALACAREISVEEIARTFLAELSGRGPALSCVARLQPEDALDSARRWDARAAAGGDLPALFGVPLAHKDMYFRRGWLTECGSRSMQGWRADKSAAVLTRLDGAGASISAG